MRKLYLDNSKLVIMSPYFQESMTHPEMATFMTDILMMAEVISPERRSYKPSKIITRFNDFVNIKIKSLDKWNIVFSLEKDKVVIDNRENWVLALEFQDVIMMCKFLDTVMAEVQPEWSRMKTEASQ